MFVPLARVNHLTLSFYILSRKFVIFMKFRNLYMVLAIWLVFRSGRLKFKSFSIDSFRLLYSKLVPKAESSRINFYFPQQHYEFPHTLLNWSSRQRNLSFQIQIRSKLDCPVFHGTWGRWHRKFRNSIAQICNLIRPTCWCHYYQHKFWTILQVTIKI